MSFIINSLMNYMNANKEDKATTSISFTITENTQKSKIDEIVKGGIVAGEDIANNIVCVFIKDIENERKC